MQHLPYRLMEYFRVTKFPRFCLKNMAIIFRGFEFSKNNFGSFPQKL